MYPRQRLVMGAYSGSMVCMTNVIIACAGSQDKWNGYLGVPSHLAPDRDGVPLLHRTVRQCIARGHTPTIVAPMDHHYLIPDTRALFLGEARPTEFDSCSDEFAPAEMNILLLGDTYFTETAINTVFDTAAEHKQFRAYGRSERSSHTGSPWGELFAYSWHGVYNRKVLLYSQTAVAAYNNGTLRRKTGWEVVYLMQNVPLSSAKLGLLPHTTEPPLFVEINDLTEDIDYPIDYQTHPMFGGGSRY